MTVPEGIVAALRGRHAVVATGIDERLLRAVVGAIPDDGDADANGVGGPGEAPWRVALRPAAAGGVADEFVLSTRLQGLRDAGALDLRVGAATDPAVFSTAGTAFAVAGPTAEPTLLSDGEPAAPLREAALERVDAAEPFERLGPSRRTLRESAREDLSAAFAAEFDAALRGADRLDRGTDANVLTLSLAVGARTDHLFADVREWAERAGIVAREQFIAPRDALVDRGIVKTIKVPGGRGHPHSRLRVADAALADCAPAELVETLSERLADDDRGAVGDGGTGDAESGRTPVWRR
ncbi:transcriptional regulator TbsP domain-containing protein [Haloparvum sedimenti]|uniref:transcriptional regulator TbsP domain-containing protein n=1 Tax=Haloparvum sedimenti TaxID=1678448 RepID=UPI00071E76D2|nr:DUF5821 family protein [Haloparvum sedimenti]